MDAGTLQLSGLCPLLSWIWDLGGHGSKQGTWRCSKEGVFEPDNNICLVNVKCLNWAQDGLQWQPTYVPTYVVA